MTFPVNSTIRGVDCSYLQFELSHKRAETTHLYTGTGKAWAPQVILKVAPGLTSKYSTVFPLLNRGATDPMGSLIKSIIVFI